MVSATDDVASALQLAAICINPVACVCQILMMIKPAWINELDDEIMKCSVGDIFMLLLDKIGVELLTWAETTINENPPYKTLMDVSETLANTLGKIPFVGGNFDWMKLKPLCFNYKSYKGKTLKDCNEVREGYVHLHGCDPSFEDRVWKQCYYSRVDAICGAEERCAATALPCSGACSTRPAEWESRDSIRSTCVGDLRLCSDCDTALAPRARDSISRDCMFRNGRDPHPEISLQYSTRIPKHATSHIHSSHIAGPTLFSPPCS